MNSDQKSPSRSTLYTLPPEVREHIYKLYIGWVYDLSRKKLKYYRNKTALIAALRPDPTLYEEALHLLCRDNAFVLHEMNYFWFRGRSVEGLSNKTILRLQRLELDTLRDRVICTCIEGCWFDYTNMPNPDPVNVRILTIKCTDPWMDCYIDDQRKDFLSRNMATALGNFIAGLKGLERIDLEVAWCEKVGNQKNTNSEIHGGRLIVMLNELLRVPAKLATVDLAIIQKTPKSGDQKMPEWFWQAGMGKCIQVDEEHPLYKQRNERCDRHGEANSFNTERRLFSQVIYEYSAIAAYR